MAEASFEINRLIGDGVTDDIDMEAVETAAKRTMMEIGARAVAKRFNADRSDHVGPSIACTSCGGEAHYMGRRPKTFTTALGEVRLERAYYHCNVCNAGICPRDRALGMEKTSLSPATIRMVGFAASECSFATASGMMKELAGLKIDPKMVERAAEALGAEIAEDERQRVEVEPPSGPTMYVGMDGTGVPARPSEREGRPGKQPDGSSKTREAKLVTVWTAEKQSEGTPEQGSVSYSVGIESAATLDTDKELSPFAQRVEREARRRGFHDAERRVVLGDGALWIWNIADELFPDAIQIIDLFHAKQHLWSKAKEIYGDGDLADAWAKKQCDALEDGQVDKVIAVLRKHGTAGYLERNRARMQYAKFRAQGLCVSSGVVEAGCKRTVGSRLKRGGMRWTVQGADAILALRCSMLSGRFEDFWERRAA